MKGALLSCLLLFGSLQAEVYKKEAATSAYGCSAYGAETLESLQVAGLTRLNGTTITGNLQVTGSLISLYAHLGSLEITGEANFTDTNIEKACTIIGSIQAVRTTFREPITLLTQKGVFTASKLEAITVRQDASFKGKQILELRQGTIVNGPVAFESGKGEIILQSGSQVKGAITGAKVVRK
jgi:hypothetical protein